MWKKKKSCNCAYLEKFSPVSHVIFDLDGTILDTESIHRKIYMELLATYGHNYDSDLMAKITGSTFLDSTKFLVNELDLPITEEEFQTAFNNETTKYFDDILLLPGVEKLIRHLHANNIPIAIATSSTKDQFDVKIKDYEELFSLFHHVVAGGDDPDVINGKPAPDIFLVCAKRFDRKPISAHCLVLEDAANGVKAAVRAGMQVVMIPDKELHERMTVEATIKLDSLEQFKPAIFGLPPMTKAITEDDVVTVEAEFVDCTELENKKSTCEEDFEETNDDENGGEGTLLAIDAMETVVLDDVPLNEAENEAVTEETIEEAD